MGANFWAAFAAVVALLALFGNAGVTAFYYGRLTEKVDTLQRVARDHEQRLRAVGA